MNGSATGLLSDSPQGQIIGVLNNDQDGLNYPAHKWGTGYYMSNLLDGQAGPWFNNINATPVSAAPNSVYGTVGIQRLQHNLPAVQAFRTSAADAVTQALEDLGQKYNFSIPLENPLLFKNTGSVPDTPGIQSVPAYLPSDQALYTPVLDDRTGPHRPGVVRRPRHPVARRHRPVRLEHRPARGRRRQPVPGRATAEQADARAASSDRTRTATTSRTSTSGRPAPCTGRAASTARPRGSLRGVEFIATWFSYVDRLAAGGRRGARSPTGRSPTSR